jgi:carboxylate-amine ligase
MAGPPLLFADRAEHDALVQTLVQSGSINDETKIYWDVRLPKHVPTVEFRVADVCQTVDEAVMIAGLVRGIVQTCYAQAVADAPFPAARPELLRAAHWRTARYGLEGELIDIGVARSVPASDWIQSLLDFIRPALEDSGDWAEVSALLEETLKRGNGAMRQRAVYQKSGSLEDVVDYIIAETARGLE